MTDDDAYAVLLSMIGASELKETGPDEIRDGPGSGWVTMPANGKIASKIPSRTAVLFEEAMPDVLVGSDAQTLIIDPIAILSLGYGDAIITDDGLVWMYWKRQDRLPRGYTAKASNGSPVFEVHERQFRIRKKQYSTGYRVWCKGKMVIGSNNNEIVRLETMSAVNQDTRAAYLSASGIEQVGSYWTVELSDGKNSAIIPCSREAITELASVRDEPLTPSGRRKAILHWVRAHVRRKPTKTGVVSHTRGIESFDASGLTVMIAPPLSLLMQHQHPERFDGCLQYDLLRSMRGQTL